MKSAAAIEPVLEPDCGVIEVEDPKDGAVLGFKERGLHIKYIDNVI